MQVILYKRHKAACPHKDDKTYRRCRCSVWMEYNVKGVQNRKSAKTFSWDTAQDKARAIEKTYLDAELGRGPAPSSATSRIGPKEVYADGSQPRSIPLWRAVYPEDGYNVRRCQIAGRSRRFEFDQSGGSPAMLDHRSCRRRQF